MSAIAEPSPSPEMSSTTLRRDGTTPTRQNSESTTTTVTAQNPSQPPQANNIWDSAWAAISQAPPPGLSEILAAYTQKGENDREMLLRILQAKSAEDERIASVASLHRTILELQSAALAAQARPKTSSNSAPSSPAPLESPPYHQSHYPHSTEPQPQQQSRTRYHPHPPQAPPAHDSPRLTHAYRDGRTGGSPPQQPPSHPHHERTPSSYSNGHGYQQQQPLPPISSINGSGAMTYGEPPRKRSRPSPPSSSVPAAPGGSRHSPEYPLSPYSADGSSRRAPPPPAAHAWPHRDAHAQQPYTNGIASNRGRVSVNSLLGAAGDDDGDVKYRRMSAERSSHLH